MIHNNATTESKMTMKMITINTIYEQASEIGEHFKKLIELFGAEQFTTLIPCVVKVLENLEEVSQQRNECISLIDNLHIQIEELQKEQQKRKEEQSKYQSEIEDIDELWRKENVKLEQYVKYLRNENNRLLFKANDKLSHSLIDLKLDDQQQKSKQCSKELQNMHIDKLKTKMRILSNELELRDDENRNLRTENDNLIQENKNLRNIVAQSLKTILDAEEQNAQDKSVDIQPEDEMRNQIKFLEDKLWMYQCQLDKLLKLESVAKVINQSDSNESLDQELNLMKMEDLPVQGPIPKEPDEKIFELRNKRKNGSRIWSFFPRLTKALIAK